jgi:hypothetical protein
MLQGPASSPKMRSSRSLFRTLVDLENELQSAYMLALVNLENELQLAYMSTKLNPFRFNLKSFE